MVIDLKLQRFYFIKNFISDQFDIGSIVTNDEDYTAYGLFSKDNNKRSVRAFHYNDDKLVDAGDICDVGGYTSICFV